MTSPQASVLLLGLGNDILTDDAIGLKVVRHLGPLLTGHPLVEVKESMEMGLALLDFMVGYHGVLIVDSIQTGHAVPGQTQEVDADGLKRLTGRTPHFLGVGETLALGRQLGLAMPDHVKIIAIEVEDPFTLGTALTPALQRAFPAIVESVTAALDRMLSQLSPTDAALSPGFSSSDSPGVPHLAGSWSDGRQNQIC